MALAHKNFGRRARVDSRAALPASHDGTYNYRYDIYAQTPYSTGPDGFQKGYRFDSSAFDDSFFPSPGPPPFGMALTVRRIRFCLEVVMLAAYTKLTFHQRVVIYIDEDTSTPDSLNPSGLFSTLGNLNRYTVLYDNIVTFKRSSLNEYSGIFEFVEDRDIRMELSGSSPDYVRSKRIFVKLTGQAFTNVTIKPYTQLFVSATRPTDLYHPREVEQSETILLE